MVVSRADEIIVTRSEVAKDFREISRDHDIELGVF